MVQVVGLSKVGGFITESVVGSKDVDSYLVIDYDNHTHSVVSAKSLKSLIDTGLQASVYRRQDGALSCYCNNVNSFMKPREMPLKCVYSSLQKVIYQIGYSTKCVEIRPIYDGRFASASVNGVCSPAMQAHGVKYGLPGMPVEVLFCFQDALTWNVGMRAYAFSKEEYANVPIDLWLTLDGQQLGVSSFGVKFSVSYKDTREIVFS